MTWQDIMAEICRRYSDILGDSLAGIYVHGSIAFGCFNPDKSDIDFLAVTTAPPTIAQKRRMIRCLLELAPKAPEKGIEMSVVLQEHCRCFRHPAPYELHYSAAHHDAYLADMDATLARLHGTDPDLAAHFTVARAVGIALMGPEPQQIFAPVPPEDYLDSIRGDVENAESDVLDNPVYILLNLCRVLAYMQDGAVISKAGGGEWGLQNLPEEYHPLLRAALDAYLTNGELRCDPAPLQEFARYMLAKMMK